MATTNLTKPREEQYLIALEQVTELYHDVPTIDKVLALAKTINKICDNG